MKIKRSHITIALALILSGLVFLSALSLIRSLISQRQQATAAGRISGTAVPKNHIRVVAVGDIMMGTTYPVPQLPHDDGRNLFGDFRDIFSMGDIVFANLEGPLDDNCTPSKCFEEGRHCFEFATPTRYARHLQDAGFTVLNIANNHTGDCGPKGMRSTVDSLTKNGLNPVGGKTVFFKSIEGHPVHVVGFTFRSDDSGHSILDIPAAQETVRNLKKKGGIVIVSFHGGAEGSSAAHVTGETEFFLGENRGNVALFSRAVIDAGADLVLGHGPHVIRALELYKGRLIAYSLGNFLTYGRFNTRGASGISMILAVSLDPRTGAFLSGQITPVRLSPQGLPFPDPNAKVFALINILSKEGNEKDVPSAGGYTETPDEH